MNYSFSCLFWYFPLEWKQQQSSEKEKKIATKSVRNTNITFESSYYAKSIPTSSAIDPTVNNIFLW